MKISLRGLREILRRFDDDGYSVSATHWRVSRGGYDLAFEVYYDNHPVIQGFTDGTVMPCVSDMFTNEQLKQLKQIFAEEYRMRFEL